MTYKQLLDRVERLRAKKRALTRRGWTWLMLAPLDWELGFAEGALDEARGELPF